MYALQVCFTCRATTTDVWRLFRPGVNRFLAGSQRTTSSCETTDSRGVLVRGVFYQLAFLFVMGDQRTFPPLHFALLSAAKNFRFRLGGLLLLRSRGDIWPSFCTGTLSPCFSLPHVVRLARVPARQLTHGRWCFHSLFLKLCYFGALRGDFDLIISGVISFDSYHIGQL